jgi:hypothetical protein
MKGIGKMQEKTEKMARELLSILRREIQSFNMIVELLILEEKGLVECNNDLLGDVIQRQEDVLSSIACLEKSRIECVFKIASALDMDADSLSLSKIVEISDDSLKKELLETAHILTRINKDIQHKKKSKALLIKQGAMIVDYNIRFLMKAMGKKDQIVDTYTETASVGGVSGGMRVDGKL